MSVSNVISDNLSCHIDDDGNIQIKQGDITVILSSEEFRSIDEVVDKELYFRADVRAEIESLVYSEKELPASALKNKAFIESVLDEYTYLRQENDNITDGMDWQQCLDEAFKNVDYADYELAKEKSDVER